MCVLHADLLLRCIEMEICKYFHFQRHLYSIGKTLIKKRTSTASMYFYNRKKVLYVTSDTCRQNINHEKYIYLLHK